MKVARRFPVIEVRGSRFEMGRQYGQKCREQIGRLAGMFDGLFLRDPSRAPEARRAMVQAVPAVRAVAPELIEEVEGIAEGAGISFDDAFYLNCAAEVGQWQGCQEKRSAVSISDECTSFAARGLEGTLVAWNMDWYRALLPFIVLLRGRPQDGPAFLAFALAGSVGRPGLSEHIAVAANQLPYRPGAEPPGSEGPVWAGPGVPYSFLTRILLAQKSTADALRVFERTSRMCGLNYTLGDVSGDIRCVESTPTAHATLRAQENFVTHANSFHSPTFRGLAPAERPKRDPRAHAAQTLLAAHRNRLDWHVIAQAQTYHFPGQNTGICHHGGQPGRETISLLAFVAEVGRGRMWAAFGPPCEHEFLLYEL